MIKKFIYKILIRTSLYPNSWSPLIFFFVLFMLSSSSRLSESMRIIEVKAATYTLSVIKAAKLKNLLIPNEIDIEQRNSQTTQVSDLIFICGVVLCTVV